VEANAVRCPDEAAAEKILRAIEQARADGDSLGGIIECAIRGAPLGLGEPVFDKLEADLAKAMLSLPATKGFEIGSGFGAAAMKGLSTTMLSRFAKAAFARRRIVPAACKAELATARPSFFASLSNRRRPSGANNKPSPRRKKQSV
jgi:hypothetical protein